jgi:ATP-dependent Clp protease ATP-binding subunit ClpA
MLANKGYDSKMGARPLNRKIDEMIRIPLSKKILFEGLCDCAITAVMAGDEIEFAIMPSNLLPAVNNNGIIVIDAPN